MQIMVPSLVPLPLVPRAVAASATANQAATITGPRSAAFSTRPVRQSSTAPASRCSPPPRC